MTEITTMQDKLAAEFAALAADAGLEFTETRRLADDGLGRPEITWHYMDGLDTRLILAAAFAGQSVRTVLAGQAVADRDLDWFKTRRLAARIVVTGGGRTLDQSANYADGDQLRGLLGVIGDLLALYAKPEPGQPGESLASRRQAAEVLAGFGLDRRAIRLVLKRAYGHMSGTFPIPGQDRSGRVDYDRDHGTYTVRTPGDPPAAEHTATETIYCRRCGQDHTETSAERLNADWL
jgi:hypothetical protein